MLQCISAIEQYCVPGDIRLKRPRVTDAGWSVPAGKSEPVEVTLVRLGCPDVGVTAEERVTSVWEPAQSPKKTKAESPLEKSTICVYWDGLRHNVSIAGDFRNFALFIKPH